jgi:F0F1-type ATP synthase membrane subunit b/b'
MISLDWSIIPAIIIFVLTVVVLNSLLFKPVTMIQRERERRTTGLMAQTRDNLARHLEMFEQYQATIRNARMEGYRLMEKSRSEALLRRQAALDMARQDSERMIQDARVAIQAQVIGAKARLLDEAREMAGRIASTILQRSA